MKMRKVVTSALGFSVLAIATLLVLAPPSESQEAMGPNAQQAEVEPLALTVNSGGASRVSAKRPRPRHYRSAVRTLSIYRLPGNRGLFRQMTPIC